MKKKKVLKLDVLKVQSFVLNDPKDVQGGVADTEPYTKAKDCVIQTMDTSQKCCLQNDNS